MRLLAARFTGRCSCGAIRIEARGAPPVVACCHCPGCRRCAGAWSDYLPGQVCVPLGVLDDAAAVPPTVHDHGERCLPWLRIDDGLPRSHGSARDTLQDGK